jgi:hypothetical protein
MELFIVIRYLSEEAEFAYRGEPTSKEEYDNNVMWHGPGNKPSWEDVTAVWDEALMAWAFKDLRIKRNSLLNMSDWTQIEDAQVDKNAWAEYRQTLRDLPQNTIDPENPVWPTPPNN